MKKGGVARFRQRATSMCGWEDNQLRMSYLDLLLREMDGANVPSRETRRVRRERLDGGFLVEAGIDYLKVCLLSGCG